MVLSSLVPERVFYYFETLCAIPHGSGNTKAISDYCVSFAKQQGLLCRQDALGNVLIKKPASRGYEHCPTVILQGHLDMVCVKDEGCELDFQKDGLRLRVDGDFLSAEGTSLGADDAIAVAYVLAILESRDLPHPPLEAVLTVDEETGMDGAAGFDGAQLSGKMLLNLDTEQEGVLTLSCAGGAHLECSIPLEEGALAQDAYRLTISGLRGGHSGEQIGNGRANAAILLGRIVKRLCDALDARLVSAQSGEKDNAIPVSAEAVLALSDAQYHDAQAITAEFAAVLHKEFSVADPDISLSLRPCGVCDHALTVQATKRACLFLLLCPNGVYSMRQNIPDAVQTSDNLGILSIENGLLHAVILARSSIESEKSLLCEKLRLLTEALGGRMQLSGSYPAWEYRENSPLREILVSCYKKLYGTAPTLHVIHGGVECGIFAGKIPDFDAVSFGPTIFDIHTTAERLSISSAKRTWEYLLCVLAAFANEKF